MYDRRANSRKIRCNGDKQQFVMCVLVHVVNKCIYYCSII